jgi:hypothetical protein
VTVVVNVGPCAVPITGPDAEPQWIVTATSLKFSPVTVTWVPGPPDAGEKRVNCAWGVQAQASPAAKTAQASAPTIAVATPRRMPLIADSSFT